MREKRKEDIKKQGMAKKKEAGMFPGLFLLSPPFLEDIWRAMGKSLYIGRYR